jgi:photosystem II stability/assembly factor-like uncharacterized protein
MYKFGRNWPALFILVALTGLVQGQWLLQQAPTTSRFRGVSAVSASVAWAGGSHGSYARTIDGGATWQAGVVPGAADLDFRDVHALDAKTAWLLSIGDGDKSRIYRTTDGGRSWRLQFTNTDPKAFFDGMAFWDARHGIAFSDPVDGRFPVIATADRGVQWRQLDPTALPPALPGEAAFAASGSSIAVAGKSHVWIGTGGGAARVFRSADRGRRWEVAATPIACGNASSGIFSVAFKDEQHGVVAGGDYRKEKETGDNFARTADGGHTWELGRRLPGFRSAIAYISVGRGYALVAVGPAGSDYSLDNGESWISMGSQGYHAFSAAVRSATGWAAGENGLLARLDARALRLPR